MTQLESSSATERSADGRLDRYLERWQNGWSSDGYDDEAFVPVPTVTVQGIDWAEVQALHGEDHAGRV